jgi:hypothetical protein
MKVLIATTFGLILALSVGAQSKNKSVDDLREGLVKYSRLQYLDLTIGFRYLSFDSCDVSYNYFLENRVTSDFNSSASSDFIDRNRVSGKTTVATNAPGVERIVPRSRDNFQTTENLKADSGSTVTTYLRLGDIEGSSVEIRKLPGGYFVYFETIGGKSVIAKRSFDLQPSEMRASEMIPAASKKRAAALKGLLEAAVEQCTVK